VRPVDLDDVREARQQTHHARAVPREVVGLVQHDVQPARTADEQELLDAFDARRQERMPADPFANAKALQAVAHRMDLAVGGLVDVSGNDTYVMHSGLGQGGSQGGCFLHNPTYDFNDEVIPLGAGYLAALAEQALPLA